jgi:predicted metal-binding protein
MNMEAFETFISQFPIYQYTFFPPEEIAFSSRIRTICRQECERYGTTWACPPAVGTLEECEERCKEYSQCFFFSTVAEVSDIMNLEETLKTRRDHEEIVIQLEEWIKEQGIPCMALSTESCDICGECAYPDEPCRFPEKMHPCVESHGIIVTELAERFGMDYSIGYNQILWFGIIFLGDTYIRE